MKELFGKNKFDSTRKREITLETSPEYEQSRELIKKATRFKKTDIEQSIILIKKAILMIDDVILSDYFKLSNYYYLAKNPKANTVLELLRNSFDKKEYGMYFTNLQRVEERICIMEFKSKNYKSYINHFCHWLRNLVIADACKGRKDEYKGLIESENKLQFLSPRNNLKSISQLGINEESINSILNEYFLKIKSKTDYMAELAWNVEYSKEYRKDYRINESFGQRFDRIIREDQQYLNYYNGFVNENINDSFKDQIDTIANIV